MIAPPPEKGRVWSFPTPVGDLVWNVFQESPRGDGLRLTDKPGVGLAQSVAGINPTCARGVEADWSLYAAKGCVTKHSRKQ